MVAGWGVVVIYQRAAEPLRAINVFDGLQYFRGSSVTLTPDGFRVPISPIDGRMAIVAWEGDPQNSTPLNGFSESLSFNGNALDDGIIVAGSDPVTQPYDGTVNTLGIATSYGVDVDTFTVDPYIAAGQTSATTVFSAGGDLVLLTAQIVSVTSEPSVDLSITKTHVGDFSAGTNGVYTIKVSNGTGVGLEEEDNTITVTDTLPAGLTYVSGTGTGWSCSAAGQTVDLQSSAAARHGRDAAGSLAHGPARTRGGALDDQHRGRLEREPGSQRPERHRDRRDQRTSAESLDLDQDRRRPQRGRRESRRYVALHDHAHGNDRCPRAQRARDRRRSRQRRYLQRRHIAGRCDQQLDGRRHGGQR